MRFDRLDLNLLVALDVLLEEQSVSAAARRLHLSQPAVTGALNRLREYFQDELLVISGRRMVPTPKARQLADPVRRSLMQIRAEITRPSEFDPATAHRRFVLVVSDYAYTILFADVIVTVADEAPGVTFDLFPPDTRMLERFERAEVDLFITVPQFPLGSHPRLPLFRDMDVVISWAGAGYSEIDIDTFYSAGHAVAMFGPDRQQAIADLEIEKLERGRRVDLLVPTFSALPQAVVGTRRLATMHRLYAEHLAKLYPIVIHPMPVPLPEITEIAQWHQIHDRDPGLTWLLTVVKRRCASLLGDQCLVALD